MVQPAELQSVKDWVSAAGHKRYVPVGRGKIWLARSPQSHDVSELGSVTVTS